MTLQKIEFEYDIPDGYRFVGDRKANEGEHYLRYGKVLIAQSENGSEWAIVEKIPEQDWLSSDGCVYASQQEDTYKEKYFKEWLSDWQEVEIEE